jgi:hypothetical protein
MFGAWLKLAIDRPELFDLGDDYASMRQKPTEFNRYKAFVWSLLFGCEEILEIYGGDPAWKLVCKDHLKHHTRFMCEFEGNKLASYSARMQTLMSEVIADGKGHSEYPECNAP